MDRFEINKKEKRLFLDAVEENKGGSGGSSEGGKYLYVQKAEIIWGFAYLGKVGENEIGLPKGIYLLPLLAGLEEIVTSFGIPLGVRITDVNTLQEAILTKEAIMLEFPNLQEITEEEFYNINN